MCVPSSPERSRLSFALGLLVLGGCAGSDWRAEPAPPPPVEGLASSTPVAYLPEDDLWPRVSPDGRYVVFVSEQNGNRDVWVRDFARRSTYPLTLDAVDDYDPDVAPGGGRIVFVSRRTDAKGDLYLADSFDSGADAERLTDAVAHERSPSFSHDGRRIFFTRAEGIGAEVVAVLDLDTRAVEQVSVGPGFDPAASPDGRYVVYTAPGRGPAARPHLVALRLSDSATRAVTAPEVPAGFARFGEFDGGPQIVFTRFPDDDDGSGSLDAEDEASLWRVPADLDGLFAGRPRARPFPLTDGSDNEMFAAVRGGFLYFTQGTEQQDILRLPATGLFPRYDDPADYFALADTLQNLRTRWFALRCAWAAAPPGGLVEAQAQLAIGRLLEERGRPDLARGAYRRVREVTEDATEGPRWALRGLAEVAELSLERTAQVEAAPGPRAKRKALDAAGIALDALEARYTGQSAVRARAALERAEILVDRGRRVEAAERLAALVDAYPQEAETAARAMLRRVDLLGVAYAPEAMGEAYRRVLERFPQAQAVLRIAAARIVDSHVGRLEVQGDPWSEVDALRRLTERYGMGPVRIAARWRLVERMVALDAPAEAARELEVLVEEAGDDRLSAARALRRLAEVQEARGRADLAVDAWRKLRSDFGDLPGFGTEARASITRVSLARARRLEAGGRPTEAAEAYHRVIDNDVTQIEAHRRYFALCAQVGCLDAATEEAEGRAVRSPRTPVARYARALAYTWASPPKLDEALEEIEQAIALNPQLVAAYVTRGWVREMQELREPGFFTRAKDAVVEGVGRALGGLLDVEIGQQGLLEQALDDYKTALRLNPEAIAPAVEAEVLLNLGNAHYRLAEQTNDLGNMRAAFERYLDALQLGLEHKDPRTELVFWERLGRAASWVDELAVGVMATRRALDVAAKSGLERRTPQLVGNLALLYGAAGEDAYARDALERFETSRARAEERSGWVVAVRDRARARLDTVSARDRAQLDGVLSTLAAGRSALDDLEAMDRGPLPSLWLALGPDATRAQFGFDLTAERDLNLALAEQAYAAQGDLRHARALREARLPLSQRAIDDVPAVALGFGDRHPTPLGILRERIGLVLSLAHARLEEGRVEEAEASLSALGAELDGWIASERHVLDRPALLVDRARLFVERARLELAAVTPDPERAAKLDKARDVAQASLQEAIETSGTATEAVELEDIVPLPQAITASSAIVRTSSAALAPVWRQGVAYQAALMRARLAYAEGLLALRAATQEVDGQAPGALWRGLDARLSHLSVARAAFERAALGGADARGGRGARLTASALAALARIDWALGAPKEVCLAFSAEAARVARAIGEGGLEWQARLLFAEVGPESALAAEVDALASSSPSELSATRDLAVRVLSRSASVALARGEVSAAFFAIDRALLLEAAAGPAIEFGEGPDRAVSKALVRARAELASARRALAAADARVPPEQQRILQERARLALERARSSAKPAILSPGGQQRLLARARAPEDIEFDVEADEGLLVPAPIDGALHLFYVDGATTADSRIFHVVSDVPARAVAADLEAARARAAVGAAPDPARRRRIVRALTAPWPSLEKQAHLLVAPGLLGAPLPADLFGPEGPALVHLRAPSALAISRGAQLVGVQGRIALGRTGGARLLDDGARLSAEDALAFRADRAQAAPEPGQQVSLDARPPVEALAERASRVVVVEAPLGIEARAPERSALQLWPTGAPPQAASAFAQELPIEQLDLPAQVLVLGAVQDLGRFGPKLDLPLAARGYATSVLVPKSVPAPIRRRFVARTLEQLDTLGPARAVRAAVVEMAAEAPQLGFVTVVGAPGLDAERTKRFARRQVNKARARALQMLGSQDFEQAVPAFERWIRLQTESGETKYVISAYRALVAILERRLSPPDLPRAAEAQQAFLRYLEAGGAKSATLVEARADLAYLYSRAHDYERAESLFEALISDPQTQAVPELLASVWFQYGLHHREALHYAPAAAALERAIALWEKAGVFGRKNVPADAARALREVGEVYLNRLSDPERAARAYRRALRYETSPEERLERTLDLARVARRRGDFATASGLAGKAERLAVEAKLDEVALSAVIEAANVAWYQGDYARGERLCARSVNLADRLLEALRTSKSKQRLVGDRQLRRKKIYSLSVCGLVAMSQRSRARAIEYLQSALRIARELDDLRETATQHNNLGRVHLEFGALGPAEAEFERAKAIDERLRDKYSLAYDLRNLGWTLLQEGRFEPAESALRTAIAYSEQAKDTNNELRARFALAELHRRRGADGAAVEAWQAALPIAERLDVKELTWQLHWRLGNHAWREGRTAEAEQALRQAVRTAKSITGRAAPSALSPPRYSAFDDLARLLLATGRDAQAFEVVDEARILEQLELLEDDRVFEGKEAIPGLVRRAREAKTSTGAVVAREALAEAAPTVARLLVPATVSALAPELPAGAAVLTFRVTEEAVLGFWLDRDGLVVHSERLPRTALDARLASYAAGMRARADISQELLLLSKLLLSPFAERIRRTSHLALVLHEGLRYVAFAALPFDGAPLVERLTLVRALHPRAAVAGLSSPLGALSAAPVLALAGHYLGDQPLLFADRELTVIGEELPQAELRFGDSASREALLGGLQAGQGVLHFAGHAQLARLGDDPLGAELRTASEPVRLLDVLRARTQRDLVVLSACGTRLGEQGPGPLDGEDMLSLAEAFHLAGAGRVLASSLRVDDLAAALVMKRFYRAARTQPVAEALRSAQRIVRARYPHPAWWAGFSLSVGE